MLKLTLTPFGNLILSRLYLQVLFVCFSCYCDIIVVLIQYIIDLILYMYTHVSISMITFFKVSPFLSLSVCLCVSLSLSPPISSFISPFSWLLVMWQMGRCPYSSSQHILVPLVYMSVVQTQPRDGWSRSSALCNHTHTHTCMHAHTCTHTHTHAHTHMYTFFLSLYITKWLNRYIPSSLKWNSSFQRLW